MKRIVLLGSLIALLISSPVFAHDPYLIKQGYLKDPQGRPLIKERLYGDGIFSDDPERFQIRSSAGALLGYTETHTHVATFCPHIKFCLAVPYGQFPSKGFRLDYKAINWDAGSEKLELAEHGIDEYKRYLKNPDITRAEGNSYPGGTSLNFLPSVSATILGPLMILVDQWIALIIIFFGSAFFVFLNRLFFKQAAGGPKEVLMLKAIGSILLFGYLCLSAVVTFFMSFTLSMPLLYMGAAVYAGGIIFPGLLRRSRSSQ